MVLAASTLATMGAGCGEVHFVPSPFTPTDVEVVFSAQEDLSILRWRVASETPEPDTRFELLGPSGYAPIDFAQSAYPGGVRPCRDGKGSCAQYVVRGRYPVEPGDRPVRAVHRELGVTPGGQASSRNTVETLKIDSQFAPGNGAVHVAPSDTVASDGPFDFPRTYERAIWPTGGVCITVVPSGVGFAPLDGPFPPPLPLTEDGLYCIGLRAVPRDQGGAAVAQARIATAPELVTSSMVYRPAVESLPVMYQIILDLEIPIEDRCLMSLGTIEQVVADELGRYGVPLLQLPTLNLATREGANGCGQVDNPRFDAAALAQAAKQLVATRTEVHPTFFVLYFNNIQAPLRDSLVSSFEALDAAMIPGTFTADLELRRWMFNAGDGRVSSLDWWWITAWMAADDPAFAQELRRKASSELPVTIELYVPWEPIQYLSDEEVAQHAGKLVKICESSPVVSPLVGGELDPGPTYSIDADDPPSFVVDLPIPQRSPAVSFVPSSVEVRYQICTRYCVDHPYVATNGQGVMSWDTDRLCAGEEYQ